MIEAIFFDFNGVVTDDERLQMKAAQATLAAHGVALTEQDYYASLGMDNDTFFRAAFARAGREADDATLAAVNERFDRLFRAQVEEELPLFPGVVTFVKAAARVYTLGVVSMARRAYIEYVLGRAGLAASFAVVVSAEDVTACKPDPACYATALARVNELRATQGRQPLAPDQCLVIEDAPPGIASARAVGLRTLGVTNTVSEAALRAAGADVVTARLSDWTTDAVHHVFSEWPPAKPVGR
ncbi:MAG TPA: HAD family phosphatase [Pyrinomonadaceae bacterium]|jgi:beta-phosphoglucomutase